MPSSPSCSRRTFLSRALALGSLSTVGGAGMLSSCALWPEQGLINPCRAPLPPHLAQHELVLAAWDGIDPSRAWDCHAHIAGTGDSGSGIWINPRMLSVLSPLQFVQRLFYLNAACAQDAPGRVDHAYLERLHGLIDGMPPGVKLMLMAFDWFHDENGKRVEDQSAFHVPNDHAAKLAQEHARHFEWIASVHPYRADAVEALQAAATQQARAVKWLPAAMGIDPSSPRCDGFYATLARLKLPLITHAGVERAVHVEDRHKLGNPLLLHRALEHGVRVIVAHCATLGQDIDLDRGNGHDSGPLTSSFDLFARMMENPKYEKHLFGDISAVTQTNRAVPALLSIIERTHWHTRLLNGSDYPLPGVMPLMSMDLLVRLKLLEPAATPLLTEIRQHNPLLFDFVLKRHLRAGNKRLQAAVFHTRDHFTS